MLFVFVGAHPVGDGRGTRPQQRSLQTIAHGVGSYKKNNP